MSLQQLVVTAVRVQGRTKAEVSRDYGVSPRWVYELCRRFDAEGEAGLKPRSRPLVLVLLLLLGPVVLLSLYSLNVRTNIPGVPTGVSAANWKDFLTGHG